MPPARTKDRLLDAASTVVHRDGAQALTLDAVAAEAEVSKGGLLYHFASKRDLIDGLGYTGEPIIVTGAGKAGTKGSGKRG